MNPLIPLTTAVLATAILQAQSLHFTDGVVSNLNTVTLSLKGPTNQMVQIERLNRTNQTWQSQGTVRLNSSGLASFNSSLHEGVYGYFRAQTTNGASRSTNAFGAVAGTVGGGQTMIGNPLGATTLSVMFPTAAGGTTVYQWAGGSYRMATYESGWGEWDEDLAIGPMEGIIVVTPTNVVSQRFLVSGLFTTNTMSRSVASGYSMLCSPLYKLTVPSQWEVDLLSTNRLGGYSLLPVISTANPQSTLQRMVTSAGGYQTFTLGTNGVWTSGGSPVSVPLTLTEGFWLNRPTNAIWSVSVPIW